MARAKSAKSAKISTQWKPVSALFHAMEPCFGKISTPWNTVSPVFPHNGVVKQKPMRFSSQAWPEEIVPFGMEGVPKDAQFSEGFFDILSQ